MRPKATLASLRYPVTLAVGACLATLLCGCGSSPTGDGVGTGPDFDLAVRLVGLVTDLSGEPLGQVTIRATTFLKEVDCAAQALAPPVEVVTDEDGTYELTITFNGDDEFDACIKAEALPPPELLLQPTSRISQVEVRTRDEQIEEVRVDFTLAP